MFNYEPVSFKAPGFPPDMTLPSPDHKFKEEETVAPPGLGWPDTDVDPGFEILQEICQSTLGRSQAGKRELIQTLKHCYRDLSSQRDLESERKFIYCVASAIYNFLTERSGSWERGFISVFLSKQIRPFGTLLQAVAKECEELDLNTRNGNGWLAARRFAQDHEVFHEIIESKDEEKIGVTFKEYHTLKPVMLDSSGWFDRACAFIRAFPALAKELSEFGDANNDLLEVKIRNQLRMIPITLDSVVVHHRLRADSAYRSEIRGITEKHLRRAGLETVSGCRPEWGFDFQFLDDSGRDGYSSTQLVGRAVAYALLEMYHGGENIKYESGAGIVWILAAAQHIAENACSEPEEMLHMFNECRSRKLILRS